MRFFLFLMSLITIIFITSGCDLEITIDDEQLQLENLTISEGDLLFESNRYLYEIEVLSETESITFIPTAVDCNLKITINDQIATSGNVSQSIELDYGLNTITIITSLLDCLNSLTYTIIVNRPDPGNGNANLSNLTISTGELSPAFNEDVTSYSVEVENEINGITVTPSAVEESSNIMVNDFVTLSGTESEFVNLEEGTNSINIKVTAEDGTLKQYTIKVIRAFANSNANLHGLTFSDGFLSPDFNENITDYTIQVENSITGITITPIVAEISSELLVLKDGTPVSPVEGSYPVNLEEGDNTLHIKITAEDGTGKNYIVTIRRSAPLSTNADLQNLILSNGELSPGFNKEITSYSAEVENEITGIYITPTVANEVSSVTVSGVLTNSGSASSLINLDVGNSIFNVVVTAEDGSEKTYTITINRMELPSSIANLKNLIVSVPDSGFYMTPAFSPLQQSYTFRNGSNNGVANTTESATITVEKEDEKATVFINGTLVDSNSNSGEAGLIVGDNNIRVLVIAEDGTEKTYIVSLKRMGSALLSDITITGGTLDSPFSPVKYSYTVGLPQGTESINISVRTSDPNATIKMNLEDIGSGESRNIETNFGGTYICIDITSADGGNFQRYSVSLTRSNLDLSFDPGSGPSSTIKKILVLPNDKILITGLIRSYNGSTANRCFRINADGSYDSTFRPMGFNGIPIVAYSTTHGLFVANAGGNVGSSGAHYLMYKYNMDGVKDYSFYSTTTNGEVEAIAIQDDGKVIQAGNFTGYGSGSSAVEMNRIGRQDSNGRLDTTFNIGSGANDIIYTVAIQNDGKIVIGGSFTSFNGIQRNRIARLNTDGSLDMSFNPGASGTVYSIVIQNDGKILVGGSSIVRLNINGEVDSIFDEASNIGGSVRSIVVRSNGQIYAGGTFGGFNHNRIVRLNTNGTIDDTFGTDSGFSGSSYNWAKVYSIGLQSDGKLIIGGYFESYNGVERKNIARLLTY